ncbi:uncharacterized protein LOC136027343 isoform X3 [Artemia franciscana]|uniref:uncharacterized protein LOC136027343 isoform X3 n=1 Tax=Artemia franciscana TaxID=6661 RepID=UPI0032DAD9ED
MSQAGQGVKLYIYDLSRGVARAFSGAILGTTIDGIWHTSVVVYGKEYFFGSIGIQACIPGNTILGKPDKIVELGRTQVSEEILGEYIKELSTQRFRSGTYNLLKHNCNNFSEDLATFLTGRSIPKYILDLPDSVLNTPLGPTLLPFLGELGVDPASGSEVQPFPSLIPQSSLPSYSSLAMSGAEANGDVVPNDPTNVCSAAEFEKDEFTTKPKVPPIVFKDTFDILNEFQSLMRHIEPHLSDDDRSSLEELRVYVVENEGSWALGDNCLNFIGKVLREPDIPIDARVRLMNILSVAALKDDVILILHQDRRDHVLMSYAHNIDRLSVSEQESVSVFLCNLFENTTTSEWLLYISEWSGSNNSQLSNIRVTTKVAVTALLADQERLKEHGTALMYNLATKEVKTVVFDDVATELAMAILQFLTSEQCEEHTFRALKALLRFTTIAHNEVPALIKMIGPDPETFRGISDRVNEIVDQLGSKVRNARGF